MFASRQSNQIDVKDKGGSRALTITPGSSQIFQVDGSQQARIGGMGGGPGLWNCIRAKLLQVTVTVVRLTGGTTPIYADQFPRAISGIGVTNKMFGTERDSTFFTGMVAKELDDFFGRGYVVDGINRQPIPGVDGTYTRTFEIALPYSQDTNELPDDFASWLGWHDEEQVEIFCNGAAQPFGISGVTITNVVVKLTLEMIPTKNLIIPPFVAIRRYQQAAAAGSNGPILTNVGAAGGLDGVDAACRLETLLFSHQTGGFVGSGTADQISQVSMPWRGQAVTLNMAQFFERFLHDTGKPPMLGYTPSVTLAVTDNTKPYAMATNPGTGALNDASARYTPLVWPSRGTLISQIQKWQGNLPLDGMQFTVDQTGNFTAYTREHKQWSDQKCQQMLAAAGINPASVALVPKLGRKNWKKVDASKVFCLPRTIVTRKAAT